ncbi:hypothetical protein FHP25_24925 [Vineibacter terrae]|uniref:Uncharacterized protein n=1 Tax=Vineibacter terrae TaxID=2586908 RepID=A0A5C8PG90_9HYPH|nr:hypothetical protein [Vineibacter terrae]TXL72542.1 hypothetical protein FHP25_24925 [Vineibacter terrae]
MNHDPDIEADDRVCVVGWHKRPIFILAVGFDTAPPAICIHLDADTAWGSFLGCVSRGRPVTCRYGELERGWHPDRGFTFLDPED